MITLSSILDSVQSTVKSVVPERLQPEFSVGDMVEHALLPTIKMTVMGIRPGLFEYRYVVHYSWDQCVEVKTFPGVALEKSYV